MTVITLSCNLSTFQSISKHIVVVSTILLDLEIDTHCSTSRGNRVNFISACMNQNTHCIRTWGVKIVSIDVSFYNSWVWIREVLAFNSNFNVLSNKLSKMRKLKERFVEKMTSALMHDFFNWFRRSNIFKDAGWSFDTLFWFLFFWLKFICFIAWSWLVFWTFLFIFLIRILFFNVIFLLFSIFHLKIQ